MGNALKYVLYEKKKFASYIISVQLNIYKSNEIQQKLDNCEITSFFIRILKM